MSCEELGEVKWFIADDILKLMFVYWVLKKTGVYTVPFLWEPKILPKNFKKNFGF